jgi:hypothetical protein
MSPFEEARPDQQPRGCVSDRELTNEAAYADDELRIKPQKLSEKIINRGKL